MIDPVMTVARVTIVKMKVRRNVISAFIASICCLYHTVERRAIVTTALGKGKKKKGDE